MQASRMIRVAKDMLADYDKLKIIEFLQEATNLAGTRGTLDANQYRARTQALQEKARNIIANTILRKYPEDLRKIIAASAYAPATPERLANVILNGFPPAPEDGMSSSEVQLLAKIAAALYAELRPIPSVAEKFNIAPIEIPDGLFSLDYLLPRATINNEAIHYADDLAQFAEITADFVEYVTGKREQSLLVYTSTTDPVTALAMFGGAAFGVLKLYKLILEVAEKQISFLQLLGRIREIKPLPPEAATLEKTVREQISKEVPGIVDETLAGIRKAASDNRANELSTSLKLRVPPLLEVVSNGARISITIEGLDRLELLIEGASQPDSATPIDVNTLANDILERSEAETRLETSVGLLGRNVKLLVPGEGTPQAEDQTPPPSTT